MGQDGKYAFSGAEPRSVDERGRSPIPKRFRRILEQQQIEELILAPAWENGMHQVRVYPPAMFEGILERFRSSNLDAGGDAAAYRFRISALPCEIDSAGRILIPQRFRDRLRLGSEVVWTGHGEYIDLLSPEDFAILLEQDGPPSEDALRLMRGAQLRPDVTE